MTRLLPWTVALGLATAAQAQDPPSAPAPARKPNVIVILTDDHGWADLGVHGVRKDLRTPHLDALAGSGVRFARGYVTAPQCVPSRAGVLTGRYQTRYGVETNNDGPLPASEKTLADRLHAAGYATGMVGKWHLEPPPEKRAAGGGRDEEFLPGRRGFSDWYCGAKGSYLASYDLSGKAVAGGQKSVRDDRFRVDVQTDAALAFIDRHAKDPFFLYLAYYAPHVPLEADEKYLARFPDVQPRERRLALAMLSAVDDGVGRIVAALRRHGVEEDTLIWFLGDNGAPLREGAWNGSLNEPHVGEKGMLTDGGVRVPFCASWKGTLPAGAVYERPVISLDIAATSLAVCGLPPEPALDGVDLRLHVTGRKPGAPHEALFWRWRGQAAVRTERWTLVTLGTERRLLFDAASAEGERRDVAAAHPETAADLEKRVREWAAGLSPAGLPETLTKPEEAGYRDYLR